MSSFTETALSFGRGGRLLGILNVPQQANPGHPMLVIPNTGLEHRVGPNRLHVHVARALAERGYSSFRFDIAGLGDSDPEPGQKASSRQDLGEALAMLEGRGYGPQFTLMGLCSGAHDCMQFAVADARVSGVFMIDGYTYPTKRFYRLRWLALLSDPLRLLKRSWQHLRQGVQGKGGEVPLGLQTQLEEWPDYATASAAYETLLARGAHLAFVFTGDVQGDYLYTEQHYDAFPFLRGHARLWYVPEMDHTLTRIASRQKVTELARDWLVGSAN